MLRDAIYILLYITKNIQIYSKNNSKTRRYSAITAMSKFRAGRVQSISRSNQIDSLENAQDDPDKKRSRNISVLNPRFCLSRLALTENQP